MTQTLKENWLFLSKMTWGIWKTFTRELGSLQIGTLMVFFCPKSKMHELKIYRGVICHVNEEWCKSWRGIDLSFQNWHEDFDEFWPDYSKISKSCTLMGCLWPSYITFDLKKYRGVMFGSTAYWCKIWRKTDFWFQKLYEEFGKFSPEHLKVSKFGLLWNSFKCKVDNVWAQNLPGSYLSWQWKKMQSWKRNWLVVSKLTWGFWWILTWALENLNNLHFNGLPLTKVYNVWHRKAQRGLMFDGTEYWCKIWREADFCFQKLYKELGNFRQSTWRSQNLDFYGFS